jgi:hypothetical protein
MGGNALKTVKTRRYERAEYFELEKEVMEKVRVILPHCKSAPIQAYHNKPSFGDMDIVIEKQKGVKELLSAHFDEWGVKEVYKNKDTWSINYGDFQVDLIFMEPEFYESTLNYFSYNDIGNLLGRVARKRGFKLGHRGLNYLMMGKTNLIKDVNVTNDYFKALDFLGYDSERYKKGFDTIQEMFDYVIDNEAFTPEIFLLENRNHSARVRDAKRKNYADFLIYIAEMNPRNLEINKEKELKRAFDVFPEFKLKYAKVNQDLKLKEIVKTKFNANIVMDITGHKTIELGLFYMYLSKDLEGKGDQTEFFYSMSEDEIKDYVRNINERLKADDDFNKFYTLKRFKNEIFKVLNLSLDSSIRDNMKKRLNYKCLMTYAMRAKQPFGVVEGSGLIFNAATYITCYEDMFGIKLDKEQLRQVELFSESVSSYKMPLDDEYINSFIQNLNASKERINKKNVKNKQESRSNDLLLGLLNGEINKTIACIDIEQFEMDSKIITEVGISIYEKGGWINHHYIVKENEGYKNGVYVPDYMYNFKFGDSKKLYLEEIKKEILNLLSSCDLLIGHGIREDLKYLFPSKNADSFGLDVVDTGKIVAEIDNSKKGKIGIKKTCDYLDIETEYLHNAGNDAHYNLLALIKANELYRQNNLSNQSTNKKG